jgi:DNA-binding transcriptional LysR family regulator
VRYFVAVAEELHFGRAAERTHVAQPALSKQIRALERELGVELLDRSERRVKLTEAGKAFLEKAYSVLEGVGEAERAAVKAGRGEVGHLSVGFSGMALYGALPKTVRTFGERFPGVELSLHEGCTRTLSEGLANGRVDVGLLHPPVPGEVGDALTLDVVRSESLIAALPEGHPLSEREEVSVAELAADPFVLCPRSASREYHDGVAAFCREAGFDPQVVNKAELPQTVIGLVAAGVGVSLVWESMRNLKRPGVVYVGLAGPTPTLATAVARRHGNRSTVVRAFVDVAKETSGTISPVREKPVLAAQRLSSSGSARS